MPGQAPGFQPSMQPSLLPPWQGSSQTAARPSGLPKQLSRIGSCPGHCCFWALPEGHCILVNPQGQGGPNVFPFWPAACRVPHSHGWGQGRGAWWVLVSEPHWARPSPFCHLPASLILKPPEMRWASLVLHLSLKNTNANLPPACGFRSGPRVILCGAS